MEGHMRGIPRTAVVGVLSLSILCAVGLAVIHSTRRSDAGLEAHLLKHRRDFERLAEMANEDVHLQRIAPDFTWLDDSVAWPRENVGISDLRWDEYRRLFRRVRAPQGIVKNPDPPSVYFPIVSEGLVPAGWTKGLVYSSANLTPVLESLDKRPPDRYWERSHVLVYKKIEDHWYIYYEQW